MRGVGRYGGKLHFTRQAFYKARSLVRHKEVKEAFILACVREERETNPW